MGNKNCKHSIDARKWSGGRMFCERFSFIREDVEQLCYPICLMEPKDFCPGFKRKWWKAYMFIRKFK